MGILLLYFLKLQLKIHIQYLLVKFHRLFGVDAAVGDVMNTLNIHNTNTLGGVDKTAIELVAFYGFKQCLEVTFAETLVFFALDKFKKHRAD